MNTPIPPNAKPVSGVALIMAKLERLGIYAAVPTDSEAALFARAGTVCVNTAANLTAQLAKRKLAPEARRRAGGEALLFARMADVLMAEAAARAGKEGA